MEKLEIIAAKRQLKWTELWCHHSFPGKDCWERPPAALSIWQWWNLVRGCIHMNFQLVKFPPPNFWYRLLLKYCEIYSLTMFCKFILVREHARLQSYFIHSFIPIQMGCDIKHLWQKMEILQQHIGRKITIFFWLHCVVCPREENTFGEKKCYYMMRLNNTLVNILCTLGRIRVFLCFALAEN